MISHGDHIINTIYISKDLNKRISKEERKIIYAHEIWHWQHKDRLLRAVIFILTFGIKRINDAFGRFLELRADRWAIEKTHDPDSFITLMEKLEHGRADHPTKEARLKLAYQARGEI